ncbi:glycosyltransferase [Ruicaihuangia caeni]|uniref:glycosyltransferase n=1 Tax=Ruicaihuangia caeni TaxID=3042517 RepID=UPI00338E6EF9
MSAASHTFLFMPESAYGPTNNCIGIGAELLRRGHRVVFAAERSWAGRLEPMGFEEALVDLAEPSHDAEEQDAGAFWKEYIREISPEFAKPTTAQLETVVRPIWEELIAGAKYCEPQLREIIAATRPDVIIEDNVVSFPALTTAGVPFVRIVSCNPLEVRGRGIAPVFSGLGEHEHEAWKEFAAEYERTHREMWRDLNEWVQEQGAAPLGDLEFIHDGDLNLYVYPEELDYVDARPLGADWVRLDSSVRDTDDDISLPEGFLDRGAPVVYFSLGSLGSADVGLMRKVIAALAETDHRVIVSKGPLHDEIELAPNMWGAEFLPQTKLLPLVDVVISHGGNNTVTESMHFGKPMVLMPLFWDQYDNAQRVHERGFGMRLDTYGVTEAGIRDAVAGVLADDALRARSRAAGEAIRGRDGLARAADELIGLAANAVLEPAGTSGA